MEFKALDEAGVRGIHDAAVMMLDSIGMLVGGEEPRRAFLDAGAREVAGRILIGPDPIADALARVPRNGFELVGRDPAHRFRAAPGEVRFRPAGGMPFFMDYRTGTRRPATMKDAEIMVRVTDALDGLDMSNSAVSPADVGVGIRNVRRFVNAVRHSTKPTDITASGPDEVAAIGQIALVIRGTRENLEREPLVAVYVSPTSPMRVSEGEALAVMECARQGLPLQPLSCPTMAATAPATMAGALAQQWAEQLALIVLAYAVRPGLPIISCSRANPTNMRTGTAIMSGPAPGLMTAAQAQLSASFHLPTNGWGLTTSSHEADLQAGAERITGTLLPALAGTNIISGAGTLDSALVCSPEQLVIDNELISIVRSAIAGVPVNADTLATGHLAEGVSEGAFLASPHTVRHLRSGENWMADLFSVEPHQLWVQDATGLLDRAAARVQEILRTHEVEPLEAAQESEIDSILAAAGA